MQRGAAKWRAWAACLAVLVAVGLVGAQPVRDLDVHVTFGWQGKMPSDRWSPVTVNISPGEVALAGAVIAEYQQGSAGRARIEVPFAATPNTTTPVHVVVWLPDLCPGLELSVVSADGRVLWRREFEALSPSAAGSLPPLCSPVTPLIVLVGNSPLFESLRDWGSIVAATDANVPGQTGLSAAADSAWTHMVVGRAAPDALPRSWIAYDGVTAIVVTPDSQDPPDARGVEALHRWVASGGRLVIRADLPGEAWRAWVPPTLNSRVEVDSARSVPLPPEARQAINRVAARVRAAKEASEAGLGVPGVQAPVPVAAGSVLARPMHAKGTPWTSHWSSEAGALVVEGRYGFGAVLLIGFDPGKSTALVSTVGAGAVWRAAMEPVVADVLDDVSQTYGHRNWNWDAGLMAPQNAANAMLERVADVPGVGNSVFIVIVACILLLALLVGPIDYFVLRWRRALHRSWITAVLWTALAGVAAIAGPRLVRTETTRINRFTIEDSIVAPDNAETTPEAIAPFAFRSGVTGIYAGQSGLAKMTGVDPASWWRGASVRYSAQSAVTGLGIIPTSQRAAGGVSGSERGGPLEPLPLALWTFRTLADESSGEPGLRARVQKRDGGWFVLVSGLPGESRVARASLRIDREWLTLKPEPRVRRDASGGVTVTGDEPNLADLGAVDGGVWAAFFSQANAEAAEPAAWARAATNSYGADYGGTEDRPGVLTRLSGPARRNAGIDKLLRTGHWAAVYLEVERWPADLSTPWLCEGRHTRVLRIMAPVPLP